ncbi:hypothetical protein ACVLV4_002584 [Rathayibacter agropyri]
MHNVSEKSGSEDPGWDRAIAALERDRDGRKALVGVKLDRVSSVTDRLEEIAPLFPKLFRTPLALWQTSSGIRSSAVSYPKGAYCGQTAERQSHSQAVTEPLGKPAPSAISPGEAKKYGSAPGQPSTSAAAAAALVSSWSRT